MVYDKMIAITGCIGSGKTYISKVFEEFGIPVFNSDECAKKVMNENEDVVCEITSVFGKDIYIDGKINKNLLGSIIFTDKDKKEQLESIVHPAVLKSFMDWKYHKIYKEGFSFVIMENAIITESKTYKLFDHIILVNAPLSLRRKRIMNREGMTEEKMELIIKSQKKPRDISSKIDSEGIKCYYLMNDETWDVKNRVSNLIDLFNFYFEK